MVNENKLLEQKELREKNLGRIEVLEQVKELLLLGNSEFATTEMVAKYYGVGLEAIKSLIKDNKEELTFNGLKLYKRAEILKVLKEPLEISIPNRGLNLFSKRAILNVGMLLRDSEVAKDIRSRLLDVAYDAETETASIKAIVEEIDEEKQLMLDRIQAEMNGDFDNVCVINAKLFALKNKRIQQLEEEKEIIINHCTTIKESRSVINRLIRIIGSKEKSFGNVWNEFYSKINYKLGINLKARSKKPLDSMTEEEMFDSEVIARNWATKLGIDVKSVLELN